MIMNPFEILNQLFDKSGFVGDGFSVSFNKEKIDIKISKNKNGDFLLSFEDSKPTIKIKKIITFSLNISGITLTERGGVFHIDFWPDIPFNYNWFFTQQ